SYLRRLQRAASAAIVIRSARGIGAGRGWNGVRCDAAACYDSGSVREPGELTARDVLARYPTLRDDHLRYLEKWGLVRPVRTGSTRAYGFSDLAVIRQAASALAAGLTFRAVVRQIAAERAGQLTFDFRLDAEPARVVTLTPR